MTVADQTVAGYRLIEQIYDGSRTAVYRAIPGLSGEILQGDSVIIKLLQQDYPSFNDLLQFRNQYTIAKNLNIPGIVHPYGLETYQHSYLLVMEDCGGVALRDYVRCERLSLPKVLNIAIQLAQILYDLHQANVIHKDIKPANILIQPNSEKIKLIDFSIASLLPKETQSLQNPTGLEGTLAYIAPEQTGRMNRGIDYRADFYALGVTLFELLAGELPFSSNEPLELVHCHIAKTPPTLSLEQAPEMVNAIVQKLMAKNAEDRYQSAWGLKHDLEMCLEQWLRKGKIEPFDLGERDQCDRFLIPEKLYGRAGEVQALLEAFERVTESGAEFVLVAGFSGIGKTAVVHEVHKPIARQRGYFIQGKFDQFNRNVPFCAFVQAFRDLVNQLLSESSLELQTWREQIQGSLGENAQAILEVLPELERIIGLQPPVPELSGTAAQTRFNLLFQGLIQVFATAKHPLVIFLDDLQWADSASLKLMELLMAEGESGHFLLIGAYRDNEVFQAHPLMLMLQDIQQQGAKVNTITLKPLSFQSLNQLVADTLNCSNPAAEPLSWLIQQKTQGNPFFVTQFLKALYHDHLVYFDPESHHWQCDLTQVRGLALTDDVVRFMAEQLQKLPPKTQESLKLAACMGNQFDLETLAIASEQSETDVADHLWPALQQGFVIPQSQVYKFYLAQEEGEIGGETRQTVPYRFLHDRVQQAAYSLIPDSEKQRFHYHIGQLLLAQIPPHEREERIFELVNQLNYGLELINTPQEKQELAQLNWIAGQKARSATAYQAGRTYAEVGLSLLGEQPWQEYYELCLVFHHLGAELASLEGDYEQMEGLVQAILNHAHSLLEKVPAYHTRILAHVYRNQLTEAIEVAHRVLNQLGVHLPPCPSAEDLQGYMAEIQGLMGDRDVLDLVHLPVLTQRETIAALQIGNSIIPATYITGSSLFPALICSAVKLSIEYGHGAASPFGYACYGFLVCNILRDVENGVKFGQLALNVANQLDIKAVKPEPLATTGLFILHRQFLAQDTLSLPKEGYKIALEVGNLDFAGRSAYTFCINAFWGGQPLTTLASETYGYYHALKQLHQQATADYCWLYWRSILNLMEQRKYPSILTENDDQPETLLPKLLAAHDLFGLYFFYLYKLMLAYLFGDLEAAERYSVALKTHFIGGVGTMGEPAFYFYDSLLALAQFNGSVEQQARLLERVAQNLTHLKDHWAHYAPMNHQHKVDLIEAEKYRVLGQPAAALEAYDRAIAGAKAHDYVQEEAIAYECAARFYRTWGKEKIAAVYMQEAYYSYSRWGAKAKTEQLEARYPDLLRPILQPKTPSFNALDTLATLSIGAFNPPASHSSSSSTINTVLDFVAILKAAQALSSTIKLEELLNQLSQIILHHSGGDRGLLLLNTPEIGWQLRAIATPEETHLCSLSLTDAAQMPLELIQYVQNTQSPVVIDDLKTELPIWGDYLLEQQPKSVLCLPLLNQTQLIGIVYLENRLASGVFSADHLLILNFLCTQAAISLENARLYQTTQNALNNLQAAQLQIIQSEKMASLGNLVAGVAHEINNPLGFLQGSIKNTKDYMQDVLEHLALYEQHHGDGGRVIAAHSQEIELDFIREDFPQLMQSMQGAMERIGSISNSLRTFSRGDTHEKISADLHEGLDSTLLILKYRLKANAKRPAIQVLRNYGDIPPVHCFLGQLNQVFMNLIANAIDALDEASVGRSFGYLETNPNQIRIQTQMQGEEVIITIGDNGLGMSPTTQAHIFDQGFTTKAVGKGTGLGLAIAQQIIVEKHGGSLDMTSGPGQGTIFIIRLPK
ncbi:trifunctional serine/threonine-protein kinase/ATP-binding protein/sensor histidine kinase [Spirulina subsalsa]|uniref:trifunctional serine/threonine-protein kinase/ATP-binding protein/sensor histidine kinase n=1 Tax=Spirulina subsalsa TaxID=54311 RepID=UPI0002E2EDB9|nr:ATP-binding sensor histidine kinase [Spirulina subsalsa]